jgi:anti-sigma B factor antagonist
MTSHLRTTAALARLGRGLSVSIEEAGLDAVLIALDGELDSDTAYTFDAELRRIEGDGPKLIVIDLRSLAFMDSTGLARLLAASRRAGRGGWRLVFVRGPRAIQRVLALTGMAERLELVNEPAAVLRGA